MLERTVSTAYPIGDLLRILVLARVLIGIDHRRVGSQASLSGNQIVVVAA